MIIKILIGVLIVGVLIGIILLQIRNYSSRYKAEREFEEIENQLGHINEEYQNQVDKNRELTHLKHDMKQQMRVINNMNPSDDNILQILIKEKISEMDEKGIRHNLDVKQVEALLELQLSPVDGVRLLGNLLNNAIEACERYSEKNKNDNQDRDANQDKENARIELSILDHCIEMKNSKPIDSSPIENEFETSKINDGQLNNKEHGHGIKIIREIVEKYGGRIEWEDQRDTFLTRIQFIDSKQ